MFIVIQHQIHNPEKYLECASRVFPLPDEMHVHQFFPSPDLKTAVCLYEAPSVEVLSNYLDSTLNEVSEQQYFPVHTEQAIGLPGTVRQPV
jgi:hypothetical protein